jgi:hypothetical protein
LSLSDIPDDKTPLSLARPIVPGADWNRSDVPEDGALVEIIARDERGEYLVPFAVRFSGDAWLNAAKGNELQTYVAGWRPWRGRA